MKSSKKINLLLFFTIIGLLASLIYHFFLENIGYDYPYNTFLFDPMDRFMDFKNNYNKVLDFDPYQVIGPSEFFYQGLTVHWPLGMALIFSFTIFPIHLALFIYLFFFGVLFLYIINSFSKQFPIKERIKIMSIGIFSYPFIFSIDRANAEVYVFIFTALFIKYYFFENKRFGLIFLSLAGAMKPYPLIFLGILFNKRRVVDILFTLSLSVFINLILIALFNGSLSDNFQSLFTNMSEYSYSYQIGDLGLSYGHTLWGFLKVVIYSILIMFDFDLPKSEVITIFSKPYALIMISFYILTLKIFQKYNNINTPLMVSILSVQMILFPFVSGNYRLLYIFIPLLIFLKENWEYPREYLYLITFGFLLVPIHYFQIYQTIWSEVIFYPIILSILLLFLLQNYIKYCKARN